MTTWIAVADSSRGRIFGQDGQAGPLIELYDLIHPGARLHDSELVTERPGSDHGALGQGRHIIDARTDTKDHEAEVFAREIAERLDKGRTSNQFQALVLIAPPEFLGLLRTRMGDELKKRVIGEIAKDLVVHSPDEVQENLRQLR